jgi:hypothetical protein
MNIEVRGGREMGTPKDPHEIQHEWVPAEETGLQTPEQQPADKEVPEHNPGNYKIPDNVDDTFPGQKPERKPTTTIH